MSLGDAAKKGIEAKIGHQNDYFVYELKVPLIKSDQHQYAIGFKVGKPIGFGLEIDATNRDMNQNSVGDHASQGEGRRARHEEMSYGMVQEGVSSNESFKLWATITPASGPF